MSNFNGNQTGQIDLDADIPPLPGSQRLHAESAVTNRRPIKIQRLLKVPVDFQRQSRISQWQNDPPRRPGDRQYRRQNNQDNHLPLITIKLHMLYSHQPGETPG